MGQEAFEDYQRAIHDPRTVHAMTKDYRAGLVSAVVRIRCSHPR
jgi:hypothetical protein